MFFTHLLESDMI